MVHYVFDPHSRDSMGMCAPSGKATLTKLWSVDNVTFLVNNLSKSLGLSTIASFELTPADVHINSVTGFIRM